MDGRTYGAEEYPVKIEVNIVYNLFWNIPETFTQFYAYEVLKRRSSEDFGTEDTGIVGESEWRSQ